MKDTNKDSTGQLPDNSPTTEEGIRNKENHSLADDAGCSTSPHDPLITIEGHNWENPYFRR